MASSIADRFGSDGARLLGNAEAKLIEHGPLAWVESMVDLRKRTLFFDGGAWRPLEGLEAFRHVMASVRPPLHTWAPIVSAHAALTHDEPLLTRDDVEDLADPRWYSYPIGGAAL